MSEDTTVSRRAFVSAAAVSLAGLAGCSNNSETGGDGDETGTETGTGTDTDTAGMETTDGGMSTETSNMETGGGGYMNGVGSDASISFAVPSDGAELNSQYIQWKASADGVTIEESGEVNKGAGHYHIMVDTEAVTPGETIPSDDSHIHYGTGQKNGVLELEPGTHTLRLQVADGKHVAMGLTDTVEVTVADEASLEAETTVDGSVVDWEVTAQNYTIEPSSNGINSNAGHLHAIIDSDPVSVGDVIPSDANHVHFGDGSTSGSLDLAEQLGDAYEPGEHTIHFQVGSGTHRATMVHTETTVTTE